jgi:hypothetical protein
MIIFDVKNGGISARLLELPKPKPKPKKDEKNEKKEEKSVRSK